ncbi:MAG: helix-turn-helix transcriptional regulator [Burkholderiales bacterium]|nr:helix-turn-helix transcriptional regulator [Burkholderiales bacterium]
MYDISIKPLWTIRQGLDELPLPRLLALLMAIDEHGSLAAACQRNGVAYRHAWGLLNKAEALFGSPLLQRTRGRRASLTPLAEKLVWADRRIAARLSPILTSLASELESEIERAVSRSPAILRIHASHGFAVETLREFLSADGVPHDLQYRSSQEALASLAGGTCDIAGFHVPTGEFEAATVRHYQRWLDPQTQQLINVSSRRQGLMVARGNPKQVSGLHDLLRDDVRFINRQQGSGSRLLFEMMLDRGRIDARAIAGIDDCEYTHAAVAAYIASGMADAGFGIETPARQFKLNFIPLAVERYFFVCRRDALAQPLVQRMIEMLSSAEYRRAIDALPGYDPSASGTTLELDAAFGRWPRAGTRTGTRAGTGGGTRTAG